MTNIFEDAHIKALQAAKNAAQAKFDEIGGDKYPCGFAWVKLGEDGRSIAAREVKKLGFRKDYPKGFSIWNPSGSPVQNVYIKEAGAEAYAKVMSEETGFKFYADSRWD